MYRGTCAASNEMVSVDITLDVMPTKNLLASFVDWI